MILNNLNSSNENIEVRNLIDKLRKNRSLDKSEYLYILENLSESDLKYLTTLARTVTEEHYDKDVYMRGLIEISNYCKCNCNYCGIRASNDKVDRYRLTKEQIYDCCDEGYKLGYRTFVMQGGEDNYFTRELIVEILTTVTTKYPDVAITLSLGERSREDLEAFFKAGAKRYLLRHETASKRLYDYLHPSTMSFENRINTLYMLKEIGYQVGAGFMVNTPTQTNEDLVEDLLFLEKLQPAMCGIGPYLSHDDTPLKNNESGTINQTIALVSLTRLILPKCLLPATTALGTVDSIGREKALRAGSNVVMPNLSPTDVREKYEIYQDKICTGDEAAHCRMCIEGRIKTIGLNVNMCVGDTLMDDYL